MKIYRYHKCIILLMFLLGTSVETIHAQDSAAASPTLLSISYFLPSNHVPYLEVTTKKKIGRKFEPVQNISLNIYFNEDEQKNLLGGVITDTIGKARIGLPPSFRNNGTRLTNLNFLHNLIQPQCRNH